MSFTRRLTKDDIRRTDLSGMMQNIASMGAHIRESIQMTNEALASVTLPNRIDNIVLSGMGGSAIGGDFVRCYLSQKLRVPFTISRSYELPAYASERTLVIASSYSGNTEETLAQFDDAAKRGCQLVALTTGGALASNAKEKGYPILPLRDGMMPRAAFAYSFVPVLLLLQQLGLTTGEEGSLQAGASHLDQLADAYGENNLTESNKAFALASQLLHRLPVIYSAADYEAVCLRWKGQLQENAKHLAFGNVLPEMNHNELESWAHPTDLLQHFMAIILRSVEDEHPRVTARLNALKEILSGKQVPIVELRAEGATRLERMLSLVSLADWTSLYLALLVGTDPTPIPIMDALKKRLAK
jgi:glucose/mannose-6-phosphate isomerase